MRQCRATETIRKCPELTGVDLPVGSHSIGVHNVLEARGELVGPDQGGRRGAGGDTVDKRRDCGSAFTLKGQTSVTTWHGSSRQCDSTQCWSPEENSLVIVRRLQIVSTLFSSVNCDNPHSGCIYRDNEPIHGPTVPLSIKQSIEVCPEARSTQSFLSNKEYWAWTNIVFPLNHWIQAHFFCQQFCCALLFILYCTWINDPRKCNSCNTLNMQQ